MSTVLTFRNQRSNLCFSFHKALCTDLKKVIEITKNMLYLENTFLRHPVLYQQCI